MEFGIKVATKVATKAANVAYQAAQIYIGVYLKQIIPVLRSIHCQMWEIIKEELETLKCPDNVINNIPCPPKKDKTCFSDLNYMGNKCFVKPPPENSFAEGYWSSLDEISKLLLWVEWINYFKKAKSMAILHERPEKLFENGDVNAKDFSQLPQDFEGGGPKSPEQEEYEKYEKSHGEKEKKISEKAILLMKEIYKGINDARAKKLKIYFNNLDERIESGWIGKDLKGNTHIDIPWDMLFPTPEYYYDMVNVFTLFKLLFSRAQTKFIEIMISQSENAKGNSSDANKLLIDAAKKAGDAFTELGSSLVKQIMDFPSPSIIEEYQITSAEDKDKVLEKFYDNMKELQKKIEEVNAEPMDIKGGAPNIEMETISGSTNTPNEEEQQRFISEKLKLSKQDFVMEMKEYNTNDDELEMNLAKNYWKKLTANEKTKKWIEYVTEYSPLEGKFPPETSHSDKIRDWIDFFKTFFSRFNNQSGVTIFTMQDDLISTIKGAYEDTKIINVIPEYMKQGATLISDSAQSDLYNISNEKWKGFLYNYKPYFFNEERDVWKNIKWNKKTNFLQRLWLWNDWVYLYLEAVKMGVDMNLSVPDTLIKQFIRIKLPYWMKRTPTNPAARIRQWMSFWYNAEAQAMKEAMDAVATKKAKLGDKLNSQIGNIEKKRQQDVIKTLLKELETDTKEKKDEIIGPRQSRLVNFAKSLYKLKETEIPSTLGKDNNNLRRQKSAIIGGAKQTKKNIRAQINKTEKRIKKSIQRFTRHNRIHRNINHKSRRRRI
jgi:hypothetical protein